MDIFINEERFSANDVDIAMAGRVMTGVRRLNYNSTQEVTGVKVVGNRKDAGFVKGNHNSNGSITLLVEEVLGLQATPAARGDLRRLPPQNVTVVMSKNGLIVKDTLKAVIFLENPRTFENGSTNPVDVEIPLYVGDVEYFGSNL